jgi:hypothetical protein
MEKDLLIFDRFFRAYATTQYSKILQKVGDDFWENGDEDTARDALSEMIFTEGVFPSTAFFNLLKNKEGWERNPALEQELETEQAGIDQLEDERQSL